MNKEDKETIEFELQCKRCRGWFSSLNPEAKYCRRPEEHGGRCEDE
jgi:hypothetical protein